MGVEIAVLNRPSKVVVLRKKIFFAIITAFEFYVMWSVCVMSINEKYFFFSRSF